MGVLKDSNIYMNTYPLYGLNRYRRFMKAPVKNGKPMEIVLEGKEEVQEFCTEVLKKYDCPESGIFAVFKDGLMMALWKITEGDDMAIVEAEGDDIHLFAEIDGEFRLCCYNLMIEGEDNKWIIQ